ncbi:hypothetical protein BAX94_03525 [Elizabethkingia meningoseptica]|uniref:restriction endonuclease subunit S n=1 Tax=Elizabethkingia meningoseptica TaxID=238 RepID=UPI0008A8CCD6|nr:restriction endonuclease subunit S [Elizabethkingia meningoseptica]OHT31652.1 hypothetical protein BGC12_04980 [Elizabethkingia meningoseptica]OPC15204.1 hypothetical protein BAX94_03525 [Elizabethkingia meningoseptica]
MRFPGFEGEWQTKKLGEIMNFKVTNSFSRDNLNYENGIVKNIHYGDIHTKYQTLFNIANEVTPYINNEINIHRISEDNYCQEGDVIFADASEDLRDVGKSIEVINLNGEKLLSGLHTLLARPQKNIFHLGFNGYLFKSNLVRTQIQKESQGTKVLSINTGRISKIKLSFPNPKEQKKIASFLYLIDQRIATQNKIIEQLETLIKGLSEKIFSQKIRLKEASDDWEVKTLGDVLIEQNEKTTTSDKYRILSSTTKGLFYQSEYFNNEVASKDNSGYKILRKNQLVFSPQNLWLGNINVNTNFDIGIVSPSYKIFNFDENNVIVHYCKYFLKTSKMMFEYEQCSDQGASVVRRNLNIDLFLNIPARFPSLQEQKTIVSFLSSIEEKIETEKGILKQLENQKQYLLQSLFI